MSGERINLVVRSNKKIEGQAQKSKDYAFLPEIGSVLSADDSSAMAERVRKLQTNLRILQKQYRNNLKQGFDKKIKAYRLEAVVERKLLKEAISSISKRKELDTIQEKKRNQSNSIWNSRIQLMKVDRENREKMFRKRQFEEKKSFSVSLNETRLESEEAAKAIHDKIIKQNENINKKRDYFTFVRKDSVKKQEEVLKQDLLKKIITNTEKLKDLKLALESIRASEVTVEKTFLTI